MTRTPVAYIRRSSADAGNPGDVSREVQEEAVRALAHRDGHNGEVRHFVDWARSADEEKELRRTQFRAMLAAVERGEVSVIYAYSLDRLARSTNTFARLLKAGKDHDVRVVTQREGDLSDTGNPTSWAFGFLVSFFAEFELRMAKARSQGVAARRVARGDHFGQAPYGFKLAPREAGGRVTYVRDPQLPLEAVLDAVRQQGSVLGAARELTRRKIPAPQGGSTWSSRSLTHILERNAPELLPKRGPSGRRQSSSKLLAQLIVCHCGTVMTPRPGGLYCYRGQRAGAASHGKFNVRQNHLMPWLQAEAARLRVPHSGAGIGADDLDGRRQVIAERLARYAELYAEGGPNGITRERYEAEKARAARELDELDQSATMWSVVPSRIEWDRPPETVNATLRAMWRHVQLDEQMCPVAAEWVKPEWRRP